MSRRILSPATPSSRQASKRTRHYTTLTRMAVAVRCFATYFRGAWLAGHDFAGLEPFATRAPAARTRRPASRRSYVPEASHYLAIARQPDSSLPPHPPLGKHRHTSARNEDHACGTSSAPPRPDSALPSVRHGWLPRRLKRSRCLPTPLLATRTAHPKRPAQSPPPIPTGGYTNGSLPLRAGATQKRVPSASLPRPPACRRSARPPPGPASAPTAPGTPDYRPPGETAAPARQLTTPARPAPRLQPPTLPTRPARPPHTTLSSHRIPWS